MRHPELFLWISILCPLVSYLTFRDLLHPHFIFTLSWVYLLPLGPIFIPKPADDLISLLVCSDKEFARVHFVSAFFMTALFFTTLLLARRHGTGLHGSLNGTNAVKKALAGFSRWIIPAGVIGASILLVQMLIQLSKSDWSLVTWFNFLIGPRFERPWAGAYVGGKEYIQTLIANLFPLAGILLGYTSVFGARRFRSLFLILWLFHLFMLVCDGSRTPMVLSLLSWGMFWWISKRGTLRIAGAVAAVAGVVTLISVMATFRHEGIVRVTDSGNDVRIEYHQDDNYYRFVHVILTDRAQTTAHWSALTFLTAAVVNPIPRYFWPGKPLLEQNFYGEWKLPYVTITFIGECVAMYGETTGLAVAFGIALALHHVFLHLFPVVRRPGGLLLYLSAAFYFYSIMRSITNLGMNMIFFVTVVGFYLFLNRNSSDLFTASNSRLRARPPRQIQR